MKTYTTNWAEDANIKDYRKKDVEFCKKESKKQAKREKKGHWIEEIRSGKKTMIFIKD